jgi:hypothetical protein
MAPDVKMHRLKSWPDFFAEMVAGWKRHDLRRLDRDFQVGDGVVYCEWDPSTQCYTGRRWIAAITYITSADHPCALSDAGLKPGFAILSIRGI